MLSNDLNQLVGKQGRIKKKEKNKYRKNEGNEGRLALLHKERISVSNVLHLIDI
jgi:hypothetical protein